MELQINRKDRTKGKKQKHIKENRGRKSKQPTFSDPKT